MDHFVSCNGKVICIQHKITTQNVTEIKADIFSFSNKSKQFTNIGCVSHTLSQNAEVVKARKVLEITTGLNVVSLITKTPIRHSRKHRYDLYILNTVKRNVVSVKSVELSEDLDSSSMILSDGPSLLWSTDKGLFVALSFLKSELCINELTINNLVHVSYCSSKDELLLFGFKRPFSDRSDVNKHKPILSAYSLKLDKSQLCVCEDEDLERLYPRNYSNLQDLTTGMEISGEESTCDAIQSLAVTKEGHIIRFHNDKLQYAIDSTLGCQPYSGIFQWTCCGLRKKFVALWKERELCIINENEMKVEAVVHNVEQVLIDDFLECGSGQLLVLEGGLDTEKKWTLADHGVWREDGVMSELTSKKETEVKQNIESAVEALQSRLQQDLIILNDKKKDVYEERLEFISATWWRLHCNANRIESQPFQPRVSLVGLFDEEDEWKHTQPVIIKVQKVENPSIKGEVWQRIVGKQWIVGITVENQTSRAMYSPHVCLVPGTSSRSPLALHSFTTSSLHKIHSHQNEVPMETNKPQTQALFNSSDGFNKRRKVQLVNDTHLIELPPFGQCTLISVTEVPDFGAEDKVDFDIILKWTTKGGNICESEGDDHDKRTLNCGSLTLSSQDVICGRHTVDVNDVTTDERGEKDAGLDLEALDAVQLTLTLTIRSVWSDLGLIPHWLQTRGGFQIHHLYDCFVARDLTALLGVRIAAFHYLKSVKASVTVHAKDSRQLHLLVQHLYNSFPDDVVMLPAHRSNLSDSQEEAIASLSSELKFSIACPMETKRCVKNEDRANFLSEKDEKENINIEHVRMNFAKRKRSLSPSNGRNDEEALAGTLEALAELQVKTDRSVAKLQ